MRNLVTLSKSDQAYKKYLLGTFSKEKLALPKYSNSKEVTFEMLSVDDIEQPAWGEWLEALIPLKYFIYSLGPLFISALFIWVYQWEVHPLLLGSAFLGVIAFHISSLLYKEYCDHINGTDHVKWQGSLAIQKGWVRAATVLKGALGFLGLSLLLGIPTLLAHPKETVIVASIAFLSFFFFSSHKWTFSGLKELMVFIFSGPLAVSGFSYALTGRWSTEALFLSLSIGGVASYAYFLKNFEEIVSIENRRLNILVGRLGFDRSHWTAQKLVWLFPFLFLVMEVFFSQKGLWLAVGLILLVPTWKISKDVAKINSCLSSQLSRIKNAGLFLYYFLILLVVLSVGIRVIIKTYF